MGHVNLQAVLDFATKAHEGQIRKYTGEPYITHPIAVMNLVKTVQHSNEMLAAALLHDTIEDTDVTFTEIHKRFGLTIANYVNWLTDVGTGNRAMRKALDRDHIALAPAEVHTIKLADLIDNTKSIVQHDPKFAITYLAEKRELLKVLTRGHPKLMEQARAQVHA